MRAGSLPDTASDLLARLKHSLSEGGIPAVSAEGFNAFVSLGGLVMIEKAFAAHNKPLTEDVKRQFEGIHDKKQPRRSADKLIFRQAHTQEVDV